MRASFLTTSRLDFGTWKPDDLPLAAALWGDPAVTKYHGGRWTDAEISLRLRREIDHLRRYAMQYWPIFLRDNGEHVGVCGFQCRDATHGVVELGCHLRRTFWSQHLGREAAAAVISHGFANLGVRSIIAGHHPENIASRQFLEHLGFHYTHDEFYGPTQMMEPRYLLDARPQETEWQHLSR